MDANIARHCGAMRDNEGSARHCGHRGRCGALWVPAAKPIDVHCRTMRIHQCGAMRAMRAEQTMPAIRPSPSNVRQRSSGHLVWVPTAKPIDTQCGRGGAMRLWSAAAATTQYRYCGNATPGGTSSASIACITPFAASISVPTIRTCSFRITVSPSRSIRISAPCSDGSAL